MCSCPDYPRLPERRLRPFMAGQGKRVYTLALDKEQPDLMSLLLGSPEDICLSFDELAKALER